MIWAAILSQNQQFMNCLDNASKRICLYVGYLQRVITHVREIARLYRHIEESRSVRLW